MGFEALQVIRQPQILLEFACHSSVDKLVATAESEQSTDALNNRLSPLGLSLVNSKDDVYVIAAGVCVTQSPQVHPVF